MPTSFRQHLRGLLRPLNLAGLFTWAAVAFTLQYGPPEALGLRWAMALVFLFAFFGEDFVPRDSALRLLLLIMQAASALGLIWLSAASGVAPVLLVMLVAGLATCWPMRWVVVVALTLNLAMYLILRAKDHDQALMMVLIYVGFQMFAGITVQASRRAEEARDRLARVNADLLATRSLLADASRDAERMRVARELHDVLGHKLTALRINLRSLAGEPGISGRLKLCDQLSAELLDDVRGVVHTLRDADGLDIATSLQALAAPFPATRLDLHMAPAVRISDPSLAETVLRIVQEALTNTARHSAAKILRVDMSMQANRLHIALQDDGKLRGALREGNGLTGMRERIEERSGSLSLTRGPHGGLRLDVMLPA
ncbi:sensor histidine kinase [Solilutibacter tolerans]|uniref:Signal transduction histidine kinase n=1 Tax=Solilutibacter tolerans TaxID=1604334 RepID=A0A1N6RCJ6_9GAMM|nr:histidine kinase [Lysobacter tolerans]SIQ26569.1 Signal transduction histidine kinase [Lysobacter tolerans]